MKTLPIILGYLIFMQLQGESFSQEKQELEIDKMIVTESLIQHWNLLLFKYYNQHGEYPLNLNKVTLPDKNIWKKYYLRKEVKYFEVEINILRKGKDAWGREFIYERLSASNYVLYSEGVSPKSSQDNLSTSRPWGTWRPWYFDGLTNKTSKLVLDEENSSRAHKDVEQQISFTPSILDQDLNKAVEAMTVIFGTARVVLEKFYSIHGSYPGSLEIIGDDILKNFDPDSKLATDPWGRPYKYSRMEDGRSYDLRSLGADGECQTLDDISSAAGPSNCLNAYSTIRDRGQRANGTGIGPRQIID